MLKSIFEGYIPCIILAAFGFHSLGGSLLAWIAFVWVFGAIATVAFAYMRMQPTARRMQAQHMPARVETY